MIKQAGILVLAAFCFPAALFSQGEDPAPVLALQQYFANLPPLSFRSKVVVSYLAKDHAVRKLNIDTSFSYAEPMFACDQTVSMDGDARTRTRSFYSFDGKHYELMSFAALHLSGNELGFKDDLSPYGFESPLLAPFMFAVADQARTFNMNDMRSVDFWADAVIRMHPAGYGMVGAHHTLTYTIARSDTVHYIVELAEDLDYYPISFTAVSPSGKGVLVVDKYKVVKYNGHAIVIPLHITGTNFNSDGKIEPAGAQTFTIDEDSIVIGKKIPPETFRVPYSQVTYVIDEDSGTYLKGKDPEKVR